MKGYLLCNGISNYIIYMEKKEDSNIQFLYLKVKHSFEITLRCDQDERH